MFKKLLLRNLIFMFIPILIIEASFVFICTELKILDKNQTYELTNLSDIDMFYKINKRNVSINADIDLIYSGFDYSVDNEIKGHYYYYTDGSFVYLFVINNDTSDQIKRGESLSINATLVYDEASSELIKSEYLDYINKGEASLDGYFENIIINQPEYPERRIMFIEYTDLAAVCLIIITIIYLIITVLCPQYNILFSSKGISCSRKKLIKKLDSEMKNRVVSVNGADIITDNYIIKAHISHIKVKKRPAD